MPGLRVPQQHEIIDVEDQRSGSLSGFGDSILRIFKTEELLHVTEADLNEVPSATGSGHGRFAHGKLLSC
jgi:hypothetical protein